MPDPSALSYSGSSGTRRSPGPVWRPRIAWWLALLVAFFGAWTILPAPIYTLLALSVGTPELSGLLAVAGAGAVGLAALDVSRSRTSRQALAIALVSVLLPAWVFVRIPPTARAFDTAMTSTLGAAYLDGVAETTRSRLRTFPVAPLDLVRGLPSADVDVTRDVAYSSASGASLRLDVYRPHGLAGRPAIVQMFPGGWRSGVRGENEPMSRAFAAQGFVVFAIDYRLSPRWPWPAQLEDVRAAIAWVKTHAAEHGAEADRVVLLGRSSGAQLAIVAGITAEDPAIRAIVALYSPVNLTEGYRNPGFPDTLGLRELETAFIGGTPDDKPDAYRDASPISYADRAHPPMLLMSGGRDRIVYPQYSRTIFERLRQSGTAVFLVIPWANHAFDAVSFGPSAQLELYYAGRFLAWATK